METITNTLRSLTIGEVKSHQNLSVVPLLTAGCNKPDYKTLDEALSDGSACVREVSETGNVPNLQFENKGDTAVLLLDGEELVGAKQNRILNLTILVPAKTMITIPVSCVEAGRWAHASREFHSEERAYFAAGRARKAAHVTDSLRNSGTRHSRQGEVWNDIAMKCNRLDSASDTDAMASMYVDHAAELKKFSDALQPEENQCGAVFLINGVIRGLDLFDYAQTFAFLNGKLVRSYALDAIDEMAANISDAKPSMVNEFFDSISNAKARVFTAVGEGNDVRLTGDRLSGGALLARDRVIHLCAFRLNARRHDNDDVYGSELSRSSLRRRHYRHH